MPAGQRGEPGVPATWDQVLAWRLDRQHLTEPAPPVPAPGRQGGDDRLVSLVRRLCGVHAQLASAAEAALWLRTAGAVGPADVRRALTVDRTLVKTWAVRGTLHLLPAADLPRWAAALGTRSFPRPRSWYRYHGVTAEDMAAIEQTVPAVLGATPVTRERLARQVAERSGRPQLEQRLLSGWGAVLKPLAARGQLAFGPPAGRSVTFVAPREWIGSWPEVDPERAVADVVRDFLDTYGPAGLDELSRWSALDKPVLRRAVAALAGELVELDTEGHRGWVTRTAAGQIAGTGPSRAVRLLPGFDPYVVGALTQLAHLLPAGERAAVSRTSGWISAVLVDGGRIVGTWTQETRAGMLKVAVTPFGSLRPGVREAAEAEARRWADYAAAPLAVTWTA
ncbi:MAG: DNA glycosylase AlkZ-like family protein [Mycobacteriales bacterium]